MSDRVFGAAAAATCAEAEPEAASPVLMDMRDDDHGTQWMTFALAVALIGTGVALGCIL